ncbi:MAG: flagellar motor protein MotB [Candidatus Omnitrophica bacterium]|nr:flagellar motor protein MotB [Candidatus Omnitrophota bacterium]MBU1924107.1 flagellar motor protein MotB [Candidatus Omnitrophota bacterium]
MKFKFAIMMFLTIFSMSGCAYIQKAKRTDELENENQNLRARIVQLQNEKTKEIEHVVEQKDRELSELEKAKLELEEALKKEIGSYKAKLEMTERGLVITFLSEVFFASGKDIIREDGKESIRRVAEVLNRDVPNSNVAIEGHTDKQPIKYSGWQSNWELSSARALAVLHYLVDECKVVPTRLSANGYGEFRPVAANDTKENMQKNRRVEIVILPSKISKVTKGVLK